MQITTEFSDDTNIMAMLQKMPDEVDKAVKQAVQIVSGDAKREITGREGLGKWRHRKGTPTPSPSMGPGNPPAQITGNLRNSVQSRPPVRHGLGDYSQETMPGVVYARAQELGTNVLPRRSYIEPVRHRMRTNNRAGKIFMQELRKSLKSLGSA